MTDETSKVRKDDTIFFALAILIRIILVYLSMKIRLHGGLYSNFNWKRSVPLLASYMEIRNLNY